jgi:arylsulfatase A-like enzyme
MSADSRFARLFVCCVALVDASAAMAQQGASQSDRPNIVLAIADDWGWPHAGAYGDPVVKTPCFDEVAQRGVLFRHAFVSSPSCTPSRGAIITGQHFWRLKAGANLWSIWPKDQFPEYPRLLEAAGYHVGTFRKAWGPGRGSPAGKAYPSVQAFFAARPPGKPFCLLFGAADPHRPYDPGSGKASGIDLGRIELFPHFPNVEVVRSDVADYYFEVQRFDREVGQLVEQLKEDGNFANTLIAITGDHNMPFPRCKGNVYDCGARVPLAICWGDHIAGDREVTDFVSLTDLAPTFLEVAGVEVPRQMTGRSLVPVLTSKQSGRVDPRRDHVLLGRERHTTAQETPDGGGYPVRALRTAEYLYIRNFRPDRWPAGTPNYEQAFRNRAWLSDCDNGPTKQYLWKHREDAEIRPLFDLCFAKRPAEELYALREDPHQLKNFADLPDYADVKSRLSEQLTEALRSQQDPRVIGGGEKFDEYPYLGGAPTFESDK